MLDFDNIETYRLLLAVSSNYAVDPSASVELENFFRNLLIQYGGTTEPETIAAWLHDQISQKFAVIDKRPEWIQNNDWPIVNGQPAVFVGQIEVESQKSDAASKLFHDDTSFYIFLDEKGPPIVVMQQH
jgi:hypothetical protein